MGFALVYLLCVMVLLPALCTSDDTFTLSRATYYGSPDCYGTPSGACGFGEFGRTVNDGYVSGVARLYRNGTGCGGCYQEDCQQWTAMRKAYGAVWDMASPPSGSIKLRFQVSGSAGITWVQPRRALPSDWKVGVAYDSDIQLT
uniref:Expansin-like EG45 domain-containing protein n=1 Tax=Fagus sylvatica TaxID=28930 RepID=A0A2N9H3Q3_FAGSY